jgi:uncharacterized protein YjbI with pentapeptide repeats
LAAEEPVRLSYREIFSVGALLCVVSSTHAADMSVRDIAVALFKARAGAAPDFSRKDLGGLDLAGLDFKGASLVGANLFGANLAGANLNKANLSGARLDRATITGASFIDADLSGASILRPNVFSSLDVAVGELPSFAGAKMAGAHLSGKFDRVSFRGADLRQAFFGAKDPRSEELITARVELKACDFTEANLSGADLSHNAAPYAKFVGANLRGANLAHANLMEADFTGADVTDADFTGAVFEGARLTKATGLESAKGLSKPPVGAQP